MQRHTTPAQEVISGAACLHVMASALRSVQCLCWAALLLFVASDAASFDDWEVVRLEKAAAERGAICLDGTAPAYYFRPSQGSDQWLLHLEGGGWCATVDECFWMSTGVTGSNRTFLADKEQHLDTFQGGAHGLLSSDPSVNPDFHNFNKVFVRSCDGSSFSADVEAPGIASNGVPVYFRGFRILKAIISSILSQGLWATGKELLVSGCSSGGHAVWLHLDHIRDMVPQSIKVSGIPASGVFLNIPHYNDTKASESWRWQAAFYMMGMESTLNKDCLNNIASYGDKWRCFLAENQIPYIRSPYFALNSMFDKWNLQAVLKVQVPCVWGLDMGRYMTMCSPDEIQGINNMRHSMMGALSQTAASVNPKASYFAYNCVEHCGQLQHDHQWSRMRINGKSLRSALGEWYKKGTVVHLAGTFSPNVNIQCRLGPHDSVFAKQIEEAMNNIVPPESDFKQRILL